MGDFLLVPCRATFHWDWTVRRGANCRCLNLGSLGSENEAQEEFRGTMEHFLPLNIIDA